jgi:hypothetical protein
MAKKKTRTKAATKPVPAKSKARAPMRRILVRCPPDLADWLDATSAELHLHRDVFIRMQLQGLREGFELARAENASDPSLFQAFEDRMAKIAEEAIESAVKEVIRTTGGVARVIAKHP